MSLDAFKWVAAEAPLIGRNGHKMGHAERSVLYVLANHVNAKSRTPIAWPSSIRISKFTGQAPRNVRTCLQNLNEGGWIIDRGKAARYDNRDAQTVWELDYSFVRPDPTATQPAESDGDSEHTHDGDNQYTGVVSTPVHSPHPTGMTSTPHGDSEHPPTGVASIHKSVTQSPSESTRGITPRRGRSFTDAARALPERRKPSSPSPSPSHEPSRFEEWWALVPSDQKKKKANARTAYPKAVKQAGDEQTVINGMRSFIESGQPFDMNASTWLNQAKWQDAPPPTEPALSDESYVDFTDVPLHDLEAAADPEIQSLILDSLNQE